MPDSNRSSSFDSAWAEVQQLAATFHEHVHAYLDPKYTEAQARQDFIDKLFLALGWDVTHHVQRNPFEQEVKVERGMHIGAAQRRADYAFFLAPNFRDVRFFVEAKKPSVELATRDNYFQALRYGWNSRTPLVVLTDFEQFHVLDCRYKPKIDTALESVVFSLRYAEYSDREKFARLYYLFSHEALASGSFDRAVEALPKRRGRTVQRGLFKGGYQRIDEAFLEELDEIRDQLARMFKAKNHRLDSEALTEITQRTVDRLVFLRFVEDKLIETEARVADLGESGSPWHDFLAVSRKLDRAYNGIVFKKHPLLDGGKLSVDDHAFGDVCERLSHENSPYDFNSIPIHILGSIYERFLGNVIVATEKQARVEPKPDVRRAGGVYYTPEYIVRHIIDETVGTLIRGKTPQQIAGLKFVDIACGSGSFLLGVYDELLRYHRQWYAANKDATKKSDAHFLADGSIHLTLTKRREILLNNIFGVDIDRQAVEVAQLALYLKLLEDETTASARQYHLELGTALLPPLGNNIVCGNSLIGTDVHGDDLFGASSDDRLNAFDFEGRFPFLAKSGGFDAVVGNPPYIRMESFKEVKDYLAAHYGAHEERADLYAYMIERALGLLRPAGRFGMIVSNKFMKARYGRPLRKVISESMNVEELVDFAGANVFEGATVRTVVMLGRKRGRETRRNSTLTYVPVPTPDEVRQLASGYADVHALQHAKGRSVPASLLDVDGWRILGVNAAKVFKRICDSGRPLHEELGVEPLFGIKTGLNEAFIVDASTRAQMIEDDPRSIEVLLPLLIGRDLRRYYARSQEQWLIYLHPDRKPSQYPAIDAHIRPFRSALSDRASTQKWYELQQPAVFLALGRAAPKIVYPIIANECRFSLDTAGYVVNDKSFVLPVADWRIVGLLNSKLAFFYFAVVCAALEGEEERYLEFRAQYVREFPLPSLRKNKVLLELVGESAKALAEAYPKLEAAETEHQQDHLRQRIAAIETQLDEAVCDLYGLDAAAKSIVLSGDTLA